MTSRAFRVVEMFEEAVSEFAGARHGIATESCSMAILLCLQREKVRGQRIVIPARTYISVPFAIRRAGALVDFQDYAWTGAYWLGGTRIVDSALRFREGLHVRDALTCLSFHARKHLKIGRGGMILTDDAEDAAWFRRARFDGRTGSVPFMEDEISEPGWNAYLTPEQAARGLQLLEALPPDLPDLTPDYPDLRRLPVFQRVAAASLS